MPGTGEYDYLVTGGAGFIGSHLCELLLARGAGVLVLDDLSTGTLSNLDGCSGNSRFRFVVGSVLDEALTRGLVNQSRKVVHLAAAVGVENIIRQPVETIETNVKGTENVLMAARPGMTPVFIASTSEVYGKSESVPFREDGDIVLGATSRSRWSYACSKAVDEFLALAYWKDKGLPVVIGRLFNTVGPRQSGRYGMVLPRFIEQALAGRPLTVFGDGRQTRCFSLVYEIVDAIASLVDNPEAVGKVINIGSTQEISIRELAEKVRRISGSGSEITLIPYDEAYPDDFEDMRRRVPDVSLLSSLIGKVPEADIDTIIREILGR
ncbi:MAG: GDP-mannose 4,6-dehydratase [Candidatus Fermentibacteraceae bacterium]|nr:GDP-mannose 4,6-dehydratase [Candidatus Fermentibacteraceae bacterium]MBN2608472.1 GDP-mannose 4,6-dehydratase [Candidatus Fermentibacteraceae bacterium]